MLENIVYFIWHLFQFCIGFNLVFPILLLIIFYIKNNKKRTHTISNTIEADYAIIVTAYEQTSLLKGVVKSILALNYSNYLIYIVADKCDISNLFFDDERVILLRPEKTLASNTRSHFYAINNFKRLHDRLTIIDSDNLVHSEYLNELNKFFDVGFIAVQGLRAAKSFKTLYAALDAARDIYYHYYDGKLLFGVGSSATLAGSGMAFTVKLYNDCLAHLDIVGAGFDKILQKQIVNKGYRIAFAESAIVYDEKTAHSDQLINQRARWINTWFKYFSFGFGLFAKGIIRFSWNQILFGLVLLRPPLFIFLILSIICFIINLIVYPFIAILWICALILFVIGFFLSLLLNNTDPKIYQSLWGIPKFIYFQLLSLMQIGNANKRSIATKHNSDTSP